MLYYFISVNIQYISNVGILLLLFSFTIYFTLVNGTSVQLILYSCVILLFRQVTRLKCFIIISFDRYERFIVSIMYNTSNY